MQVLSSELAAEIDAHMSANGCIAADYNLIKCAEYALAKCDWLGGVAILWHGGYKYEAVSLHSMQYVNNQDKVIAKLNRLSDITGVIIPWTSLSEKLQDRALYILLHSVKEYN